MKKRLLISLSTLLIALLFLFNSCKKDDNSDSTLTSGSYTTVSGIITDRQLNPIAGATVSISGKTATTDANGLYLIPGVSFNDRCVVKCEKQGYFEGVSRVKGISGGVTRCEIRLIDATPDFTFSAGTPQQLQIVGGAEIQLSANGYQTSNGNNYSGQVNIAVEHLNPDDADFNFLSPGTDLAGKSTSGEDKQLLSYGMLLVKMTDNAGNDLELSSGNTSEIKMPVPSSLIGNAPSSIPLWHFNESSGVWEENGSATLQGNFYIGTVSHFSSWNCDYPTSRSTIRGRVLDCQGNPVPGIRVTVGQTYAITNNNGDYETYVPSGVDFDIKVNEPALGISSSSVSISALTAGDVSSGHVINVSCPAYITGTISCSSSSAFTGLASVTWSGGSAYAPITSTGTFKIAVPANGANATLIVSGTSNSFSETRNITFPTVAGQTTNAGTFSVCGSTGGQNYNCNFTINGDGYTNQTFSLSAIPTFASATYFINDSLTIGFITQNNVVMEFAIEGKSTGSWNTQTSNTTVSISINGKQYIFDNVNLNVTQYGNVGGKISGNFSGTFVRQEIDQNTGQVTTYNVTVTNGNFEFFRNPDSQ
jgi:hypothetical protein